MNTYKMTLEDSVDSMTFDLLEVPIVDKDVEGAVDNTTLDGNIFTDYLWLKKNYVQKWSIMCDDEYSRLRGFYTRQFDNASVPTYKLFYGENISEDRAISGDYILVDNTTDRNAPLTSFELLGDAEQMTYSGKNLLYWSQSGTTYTSNGITYTLQSDGTVKVNGTASANSTCYFGFNTLGEGRYVLSGCPNGGSASTYYLEANYKQTSSSSSSYPKSTSTTANAVVNLEATGSVANIYITVKSGTTVSNIIFKPMLEQTSGMATDYEPYVGGTASPNPDYPQAVNTVTGEQTVKIEGKNLFSTSMATSIGSQITIVDSNSFTAQTTGNWQGAISFKVPVPKNTEVHFNWNVDGTASGQAIISRISGVQTSTSFVTNMYYNYWLTHQNTTTFNTGENSELNIQLYAQGNNGTAGLYTISNLQLEVGSQFSSFEPYQAQTLPVNLGKNLLNSFIATKASWQAGNLEIGNDGRLIVSENTGSNNYFQLTQKLSELCPSLKVGDTAYLYLETTSSSHRIYVAGASWVNAEAKTITQAMLDATVVIYGGYNQTDTIYLMVTKSLDDSYAPYFTPIELCKIGNYQDRIYKSGGKWYIEKQVGKVVFDGTESWTLGYTGTPNFMYVLSNVGGDAEPSSGQISRLLKSNYGTDGNVGATNTDEGILIIVSTAQLRVRYGSELSIDAWKAKLVSNNMILYYALATPTTTEITNQALIDQLNAIQNASLYTGINNISNSSVNLAGDIDLGYTLIYEKENIIIPQTSVRLTLTDGGVINVCGCRQNVQLGMRETIQ